MRARGAPVITTDLGRIAPEYAENMQLKSVTKKAPLAIRASKPVKVAKATTKAPKERRGAKPKNMGGYTWRKDGAGWELRKTVYIYDGTGAKIRKRPYVARMAKTVFDDMRKQHRGAALEKALARWIADRDH